MSLAQDFIAYLRTKTDIVDFVREQIVHGRVPEAWQPPYITLIRQNSIEDPALGGADGYDESEYIVRCVGTSPDQADTLAAAAHDALNGYRGTWGTRTVQGAFVTDKTDESQRFPPGSDDALHLVEKTVRIFSHI